MISIEQAREKIVASAKGLSWCDMVGLEQAYNRILTVDCTANVDVPPFNNSAMDGYAIHVPSTGAKLPISQTIAAGTAPDPLLPNTAARILTGANIPEGANAVVIQENCRVEGDELTILKSVSPGENIRLRGQDIKKGAVVIPQGGLLTAASLGVLASCGIAKVSVVERPKIGIINSGSELVEPGTPLQTGQTYNSNVYFLSALFQEWGCDVVSTTLIPDDLEKTKDALKLLSEEVDFIISSGGVSVGDEDHIKPAIEAIGEIELWKICIKPGKPLAFGKIFSSNDSGKNTPIMGLPGNPVSAFVTAVLFAKPFIEALVGRPYKPLRPQYAPANFTINKPRKRPEFIRVKLKHAGLTPFVTQSSGVLRSVQRSDALALIPEGKTINMGDRVAYYPMHALTHLN